MRSEGFKEVYELKGGIMKWRSANLPETTDNNVVSRGMSHTQFEELLKTNNPVLIDFYADWCGPCKKIKLYVDEISQAMSGKLVVIRINSDDNPELCKELKIDAIPTLQLYKDKMLTWTNVGLISKEEITRHLQ